MSGVVVSSADFGHPVFAAILAGLVIGKPLGVVAFTGLALRLGLAIKPSSLSWALMVAGAFLTGIGFTMSLFIASLAYDAATLDAAKIGILSASAVSATGGLLVLLFLALRMSPIRGHEA